MTARFAEAGRWPAAGALAVLLALAPALRAAEGWLSWRGPHQTGVSDEKGLPDRIAAGDALGTFDLAGRSTPVIADGRVYAWGYRGQEADMQEVLVCLDAGTGKPLWEHAFNDFLSDIIYERYSIGAPTVDAETGNVYILSAAGIAACFSPEGKLLWRHSMMEEFGRLTFPNGRTGSAVIDEDLVIFRGITSNWGAQGPGRDRFYAFDKKTGKLVWVSTPGDAPLDSAWGTPLLAWKDGRRVLYAGTGCGNIVGINARTGEPLWRFEACKGGVNVSLVPYGDTVISIHNLENVDNSETGRMAAVRVGPAQGGPQGPVVLGAEAEAWRNPLAAFSSSPVIVGDLVYQMTQVGELHCMDAKNGEIIWTLKLGSEQLHASPLYADGKLYVPMLDGRFFVVKPGKDKGVILSETKLDGNCLGAPAVWDGRIYVQTTAKLYCFGGGTGGPPPSVAAEKRDPAGEPVALQVIPSEVLLAPGDEAALRVRSIDARGYPVADVTDGAWQKFIPPTAAVRSEMDAAVERGDRLMAGTKPSAGAFQVTSGKLKGTMRGRVMARPPFGEDLESFELTETSETDSGLKFAHPPLPWIGGRFKWEVQEKDGGKVLAKTLAPTLFQRAFTFIGSPDLKNYTIEADVWSDGNRRTISNVGVINQRYLITLVGNAQQIEVSSNYERFRHTAPFAWKPNAWYRLKARVDVAPDGSGVVRAKAWPRGGQEPEAWNIEVPHRHAHESGAPGVFGFALQSRVRVYLDNIAVSPND